MKCSLGLHEEASCCQEQYDYAQEREPKGCGLLPRPVDELIRSWSLSACKLLGQSSNISSDDLVAY